MRTTSYPAFVRSAPMLLPMAPTPRTAIFLPTLTPFQYGPVSWTNKLVRDRYLRLFDHSLPFFHVAPDQIQKPLRRIAGKFQSFSQSPGLHLFRLQKLRDFLVPPRDDIPGQALGSTHAV